MRHIWSRQKNTIFICENAENVINEQIIIGEYTTQHDASEEISVTEEYVNQNVIEEYVTQHDVMEEIKDLSVTAPFSVAEGTN